MRWVSTAILGVVLVLALAGCQGGELDFDQALEAAAEGQTLVMLDFYTDWCSWCRRMEEDTFSQAEVLAELSEMVMMRVNAERGGEALAERYGVDGYPTMVFVDPRGEEVDRLVGYFDAKKFVTEVRRIRAGDTFAACLSRLDEDPADLDALRRSVDGLLERSDPSGAITRVEAFHAVASEQDMDECRHLMFQARAALQARVYAKAAKIYRKASMEALEVPDTLGSSHLRGIVEQGLTSLNPEEQALQLRQARLDDAAALLGLLPVDRLSGSALLEVADFAYANGHHGTSAGLYRKWYESNGEGAGSAELNRIAWRMYLMGEETEVALAMARRAYAEDDSPDVADTVARLLYIRGSVDEAIALQSDAAAAAGDKGAGDLRDAVALMKKGADLGDQPGFDLFPGDREDSL